MPEEWKSKLPDRIRMQVEKTAVRLKSFSKRDFIERELDEPSRYLLVTPGKLLRPTLVFLGAEYIGSRNLGKYVGLASSIELLHVSSLIHDDIIDKDIKRRGKKAVHAKFGAEKAILAGDALISKAIQEATPYGSKVVDAIAKAAMKMCAGEVLDYKYQSYGDQPSISNYLKVARLKSTELIGTAAAIPALHASNRSAGELYRFGIEIGVAFQIRDDIQDFGSTKGGRRLNVVRCIMKEKNCSKEKSIDYAASLNRNYVKSAIGKLKNNDKASLLRDYAGMIGVW